MSLLDYFTADDESDSLLGRFQLGASGNDKGMGFDASYTQPTSFGSFGVSGYGDGRYGDVNLSGMDVNAIISRPSWSLGATGYAQKGDNGLRLTDAEIKAIIDAGKYGEFTASAATPIGYPEFSSYRLGWNKRF